MAVFPDVHRRFQHAVPRRARLRHRLPRQAANLFHSIYRRAQRTCLLKPALPFSAVVNPDTPRSHERRQGRLTNSQGTQQGPCVDPRLPFGAGSISMCRTGLFQLFARTSPLPVRRRTRCARVPDYLLQVRLFHPFSVLRTRAAICAAKSQVVQGLPPYLPASPGIRRSSTLFRHRIRDLGYSRTE